jgi:adenosylcobinamide-phosphate synthase
MTLDRAEQLLVVLVLEVVVGYPNAIYRRIKHPVVWFGAFIAHFERCWNRGGARADRLRGCGLVLLLAALAIGAGWLIMEFGESTSIVFVLLAATTGLAQRSLYQHVVAVFQPLAAGDLPEARCTVGRIVGRDTRALDEEGVSAAAIESLAESFCDGIVAPAFWFLAGGLPGLLIYKAVNTADSMIGHKDARFLAFGWAAARTDDVMNFIPARIAGLLICCAGWGGVKTMVRDAPKHASPNAGWTEAAMAGVLHRQLGGTVSYDGEPQWRPAFGTGGRPTVDSLRAALRVYLLACGALWAVAGVIAWLH